jgi:hypothetical protein
MGVDLAGCTSGLVRIFGITAGLAYRADEAEVTRRHGQSSGAITQHEALDVLMGLPVGSVIAHEDLAPHERAALHRVPQGAVEISDAGSVKRLAVAPISVQLAVVTARDLKAGLKKAGRFAPFCARAVLLPTMPGQWEDARIQASYFGVGVFAFSGGRLHTLLEPAPYLRRRHTTSQWWFAEEAWKQITESGSVEEQARASTATRGDQPKP